MLAPAVANHSQKDLLMRRIAPLLTSLLLFTGACDRRFEATETRSLVVEHRTRSPLVVSTRNGSISVETDTSLTEVRVEARLKATGRTQEDADLRLPLIHVVSTRKEDGSLEIHPVFPEERQNGEGCSLSIRIPSVDGLDLSSSNGSIKLVGTAGDAVVRTSNGRVEVDGHDGDVKADSSNGRITVTGTPGSVTVRSSNGGVKVRDADGPVVIHTSNGSVELVGSPQYHGLFDIHTSNGSVAVSMPEGVSQSVAARTSNGKIEVEHGSGVACDVSGSKKRKRIVVGGGQSESVARSSNGNIKLRFGRISEAGGAD